MVNHRTLTAAMIDSRDFIAAKRRTEAEVLLPAGPKIAFTGGLEFNDHHAVWDRLDKVHAKHPDMVAAPWWQSQGRRAHRRLLGKQSQGPADRVQARLDPPRQGRAVQTQRSNSWRPADRGHRVPGLGHLRQPGR
jgi:hypothetical protein